jgi:peptide chain release factor subunit 1
MPIERDLRASVAALAAIPPGPHWVVSCYLKLEPRDKTRGKYLIKMLEYFEDPGRLPSTRGIAIFASQALHLFEALALPHVHRSRLGVDRVPLVRELVALEEEFGTILVAVCDRTAARFFEVTAFDCVELTSLAGVDASRGGKFHGSRQVMARGGTPSGSAGEHNYHMRIRTEKQRLYAHVADRIFQIHSQRPLAGLVVAGVGADAGALVPHLHTYLHDLVLGVVKLNPKKATAAEVREAALALREERERAWERAHADAVREGVGTGWAVNGIDATLKTLARGQVRTLLADGQDDDSRIDDAIEDALRQRAQVDVLYDDKARRVVDGLAALLRFRA